MAQALPEAQGGQILCNYLLVRMSSANFQRMLHAINPLYVLSGLAVGILVGQTGVGGGSLLTPLLVLLFGFHPATAIGTDLLYAAATKSVGTLIHGLNRTVDWRVVRRLATGSTPATLITLFVISRWQVGQHGGGVVTVILGVMLLLTAACLVLRRYVLVRAGPWMERRSDRGTAILTVILGAALGVLVTITSVGGGALGVTALLLLYPRSRTSLIVGSDIAHAVPMTLVAGLGYWSMGSVDWSLLISLLFGSVPGITIGSYVASRLPDSLLRGMLAAVLTLVGARLLL